MTWCCTIPAAHIDTKTAIVLLGGPALYLAGNSLFKRLSAPNYPLSHMRGPCDAGAADPGRAVRDAAAAVAATTAVLIIVAVWETISLRPKRTS